jgi:hypothetical protein
MYRRACFLEALLPSPPRRNVPLPPIAVADHLGGATPPPTTSPDDAKPVAKTFLSGGGRALLAGVGHALSIICSFLAGPAAGLGWAVVLRCLSSWAAGGQGGVCAAGRGDAARVSLFVVVGGTRGMRRFILFPPVLLSPHPSPLHMCWVPLTPAPLLDCLWLRVLLSPPVVAWLFVQRLTRPWTWASK